MARRTYATPTQYAEWLDVADPPAGAVRALAEATIVVDELLLTACYDVDDTGTPTDTDVAAALRDATCAQAAYAKGIGDPNSTGATAAWGQVAIGSARLGRTGAAGGGSGGDGGGRYSPTAVALLRSAGLLGHEPYVCG